MDQKQKLSELIKDIQIAMMTTVEEDGSLRSRPMYNQNRPFDGKQLWFFTRHHSPKVDQVEKRHTVNLSYSAPDSETYVSVSGQAHLVTERAKMEELWNPMLKAWFPEGLDDPELALLRVDVEKAEYWDSHNRKMVHLLGFLKAVATGETYNPGENKKVDMTGS